MEHVAIVGAGKIGSMIAELLVASGDYAVTVIDRSESALEPARDDGNRDQGGGGHHRRRHAAKNPQGQVRRLERRALPRHAAHRRSGQERRRALSRLDRGRGEHACRQAAGGGRTHGVHSPVRSRAGLHHHRGERPRLALRRAAGRAYARGGAAQIPLECAQLQPHLEHGRRHQRVLRALRGHRQRSAARDSSARGAGGVLPRRRVLRGVQHLRRSRHALRDARRQGAQSQLPHHPLSRATRPS